MMRTIFLIFLFSFSCIASAESAIYLNGKYELRTDTDSMDIIGDFVCFYPDAISAKLLPRSANDVRIPWFCFNNTIAAKKLLDISLTEDKTSCGISGSAMVKVKDYKVALGEGEQFDTATLILAKGNVNQKSISCKATEQVNNNSAPLNKLDAMYDDCLKDAGSVNNTSVTTCAMKTSAKAQEEIDMLYRKTHEQLLSKSAKHAAKFEQSQQSWVNYRNTQCELATEYVGSPMVAYCPMKRNILRVNELLELDGQSIK
jgi:uncharacterized protein YecT (DUF1311 family)